MTRFFRGWSIDGTDLHVQLWNEPTAPGPITVHSLTVTAVDTQAAMTFLAFGPTPLAKPLPQWPGGAATSRGVSLNNELSAHGEIRAQEGTDIIGGQLYNFALLASTPHTIQLGGEALRPGRGIGIRVPERVLTRFGWCWSE